MSGAGAGPVRAALGLAEGQGVVGRRSAQAVAAAL